MGNPEGSQGNDIDPDLLRDTGRASAIQDLADQAKKMGDRAVALEKSTQQALVDQIRRHRRSTTLLSVGLVVVIGMLFFQIGISRDNQRLIEDTDRILEDVEFLADYVEENEAEGTDPQLAAVFRAVLETRQLVCASSDPALRDACSQLEESSGLSPGDG